MDLHLKIFIYITLKDEVRSRSNEWSACGMRGNHSAPLICEAVLSPDRLVGPIGKQATEQFISLSQ